jgi:hypothetical protein
MTRTIQDQGLRLWEVYANPGDFGSADRAIMVFQCLTEPGKRARVLRRETPRSAVEQQIVTFGDDELLALLEVAEAVK